MTAAVERLGRHPAAAIFLLVSAIYALTAPGYVLLADGDAMVAVTSSLLHGRFDIPASLGNPGLGGLSYSVYGIGWSLVDMPPYALGLLVRSLMHIAGYRPEIALSSFTNVFIGGGVAATVFATTARLTASRTAGAWAALAAAGSPLWVISRDAYNEPLAMLGLAGGLLAAVARRPLATGSLLGLAMLTRYDEAPVALVVAAYAVWGARGRRRALLMLASPMAVAVAIMLAYNAVRFGSPLDVGSAAVNGFGAGYRRSPGEFVTGIGHLLADPQRGALFFMPGLLACTWLAARLPRAERLTVLGVAAVQLAVHANLFAPWLAGLTWGPRYLYCAIPFVAIGAGYARAGLERAVLGALLAVDAVLQAPAVVLPMQRYWTAIAAGVDAGPWPPGYLWAQVPAAVWRTLSGTVPAGRITDFATPAQQLDGATILNTPGFFWLLTPRLGAPTLPVVAAALLLLVIAAVAAFAARRAICDAR